MLVKVQQDPLIGSVLDGSYEVLSLIGHGGMGVVYKARHKLMDRVVAIKMLKSQLVSDSQSVKRFQQEVRASARIDHPHAITVYSFGISPDGLPYIVMNYLEGLSLAEIIKKDDHIEVDRCVKIISQTCEALQHAHKQGVVHRDLKPSNIVLVNYDDDPDFVKVVDFGVAKLVGAAADAQRLTQTGEVCGSPVYMSPEQCMGLELDLRSDIYSMGIVVYETLTGKLPLIGRTMVDTMSKHVSEMPPPLIKMRPDLYIPERLEQVIFKAMSKDPANRHQTMEELREDLEYAIPKPNLQSRGSNLRQTQAASASPIEPVSQGISKNLVIVGAVVSFALFAAGLLLVSVVKGGSWGHEPIANQAAIVAPTPANEAGTARVTGTGAGSGTRAGTGGSSTAAATTAPGASTTIAPGALEKTPTATIAQPQATAPKSESTAPATTADTTKVTSVAQDLQSNKHPETPENAGSAGHKTGPETASAARIAEHKNSVHRPAPHEMPRTHSQKKMAKQGGENETSRFQN